MGKENTKTIHVGASKGKRFYHIYEEDNKLYYLLKTPDSSYSVYEELNERFQLSPKEMAWVKGSSNTAGTPQLLSGVLGKIRQDQDYQSKIFQETISRDHKARFNKATKLVGVANMFRQGQKKDSDDSSHSSSSGSETSASTTEVNPKKKAVRPGRRRRDDLTQLPSFSTDSSDSLSRDDLSSQQPGLREEDDHSSHSSSSGSETSASTTEVNLKKKAVRLRRWHRGGLTQLRSSSSTDSSDSGPKVKTHDFFSRDDLSSQEPTLHHEDDVTRTERFESTTGSKRQDSLPKDNSTAGTVHLSDKGSVLNLDEALKQEIYKELQAIVTILGGLKGNEPQLEPVRTALRVAMEKTGITGMQTNVAEPTVMAPGASKGTVPISESQVITEPEDEEDNLTQLEKIEKNVEVLTKVKDKIHTLLEKYEESMGPELTNALNDLEATVQKSIIDAVNILNTQQFKYHVGSTIADEQSIHTTPLTSEHSNPEDEDEDEEHSSGFRKT